MNASHFLKNLNNEKETVFPKKSIKSKRLAEKVRHKIIKRNRMENDFLQMTYIMNKNKIS